MRLTRLPRGWPHCLPYGPPAPTASLLCPYSFIASMRAFSSGEPGTSRRLSEIPILPSARAVFLPDALGSQRYLVPHSGSRCSLAGQVAEFQWIRFGEFHARPCPFLVAT